MDYGLLLEVGTILSIVAIVLPVLAALGVFKSRRQRELDAAMKLALRQGSRRSVSSATPSPAAEPPPLPLPAASASAYDPLLRSRAKAFDSIAGSQGRIDIHSALRTQRRYRRTSCVVRHASKTSSCPRCGYLL